MKYYKLWKVKNGWVAAMSENVCQGNVLDMAQTTIHHSLRAFPAGNVE